MINKEDISYPSYWSDGQINHLYNEIFNQKVYDFFNIDDGDVLVDIGANIGMYSLYTMNKNPNISKVYMVEPMLNNFEYMIKNVILNFPQDIHKFVFVKGGISDKDGYCNIGGDNLSPSLNMGDEKTKIFSFMNFIDFYNIKKIDILKFDIEGSEIEMLNDEVYDYINKNVNKICGELHPLRSNHDGYIMYDIIKKFIELGYEVKVLSVDGFDITNILKSNVVLHNGKTAMEYYNEYNFYAEKLIK